MCGNGRIQLEMAGNWQKWLQNSWKLLGMTENWWKWLEMAILFRNGWKWPNT